MKASIVETFYDSYLLPMFIKLGAFEFKFIKNVTNQTFESK